MAAFAQVDKERTGLISKDKWCKIMDNVSAMNYTAAGCKLLFGRDSHYRRIVFFTLSGT